MYEEGHKLNKISLPTYPFAQERYWFSTDGKIKASSFSPTVYQAQTIPTPASQVPMRQDKLALSNPEEIAQKVEV
ncbi:MAG: hypothetical protein AAGB15_12260, partial [Pseudomonadota bacterium]